MLCRAGTEVLVSSFGVVLVPVMVGACTLDNRVFHSGDIIVADDGDTITALTDTELGLIGAPEWTCGPPVDEVFLISEE